LPTASRAASLRAAQEGCFLDEENLSAAQSPAREQARISGSDEHAMGPSCAQPAAQEGSKAPDGVGALEARRALRPEGLPRSWRLTRGSDLAAVQREGRRHRTPRLDIAWRGNSQEHPRLGVIVPRHGQTIVARNRLRRRLREILRRRVLSRAGAVDVVVRSRPAAFRAGFGELAADLESWARSSLV
jgi:ribonuclease P protein component